MLDDLDFLENELRLNGSFTDGTVEPVSLCRPAFSTGFRQRVLDAGFQARQARAANRRVLGVTVGIACLMMLAAWSFPFPSPVPDAFHTGDSFKLMGSLDAEESETNDAGSPRAVAVNVPEWQFVDSMSRRRERNSRIILNVF